MMFVHLHDSDGDDIFVRVNRITAIIAGDDGGSDVWIEHDSDMVHVTEMPAVVLALLKELAYRPDGATL